MTRSTAIESRHRVLLVDDDAVSLELMALLLAHEGHQVLRAHDAGAALDLLSSDQVGRPDVLPIGDYGVLQGWALTHRRGKMPKPKELGAFGERWKPYRTVASWYMWRAVHLDRAKKAADNLKKGAAKGKKSAKSGKKKTRE